MLQAKLETKRLHISGAGSSLQRGFDRLEAAYDHPAFEARAVVGAVQALIWHMAGATIHFPEW